MKKLQCELCQSIDIIKIDQDTFMCEHCGCKYTAEQARNLLFGSVETTIGNAELTRLIKNAETQMELGQPAEETIERIIKEFPADYHGYWLYLKNEFNIVFKTKTLRQRQVYARFYGIPRCKEVYDVLLKVLDNQTELSKDEVQDFWESNFRRIYEGLINGEITGLSGWSYYDVNVHSLMKKAQDEGINNAKLLSDNNIFIQDNYDSIPYRVKTKQIMLCGERANYVLGKEVVIAIPYGSDEKVLLENPLIITSDNIAKIKQQAIDNTFSYIKRLNRCPKCSGQNMSKLMLGNGWKCSHCGTKFIKP